MTDTSTRELFEIEKKIKPRLEAPRAWFRWKTLSLRIILITHSPHVGYFDLRGLRGFGVTWSPTHLVPESNKSFGVSI